MTTTARARFRVDEDTLLIIDGEMMILVSTELTPQTQFCHVELLRVDVKPDNQDWKVTLRTHGKYSDLVWKKILIPGARIPAFQAFIGYAKELQAWSLSQDQF